MLANNVYRLLPTPDYDPEDEVWEFVPGSIVNCEWKELYEGPAFVVTRLASLPS